MTQAQITVVYSSVDGCRIKRKFKTQSGAAKFATKWVGETPEIGSYYAISGDGIGKVTVHGATLADLFTATADPVIPSSNRPSCACNSHMLYWSGCSCAMSDWETEAEEAWQKEQRKLEDEAAATHSAEMQRIVQPRRAAGCTCSDQQLNLVGCDCWNEKCPF